MNLLGDLERAFAATLYPNRIAISVGLLILVVILGIAGRRRGWFAAARRHPGRSAAAIVVTLAICLPGAWYLGSPLFIRTSLDEPALIAVASPAPRATADPASAGPLPSGAEEPHPPSPSPALEPPRAGTFKGADEFHFGRGTATLIETAPGAWTVRFGSFSVRNGPDLYVYLSPDAAGYTAGAIELGKLRATDGTFNMDLPAGSDPSIGASVVVWCKQFAVQFAVATLAGPG